MDEERPSPGRRKFKFAPKAPPRRKLAAPKTEEEGVSKEDEEAAQAQKLMNKFNENLRRKVPKAEKKSSVQVAFGPGATSSSSKRSYGIPASKSTGGSSGTEIKDSTDNDDGDGDDQRKVILYSPSALNACPSDVAVPPKIKRDYKEPWDYNHTYYPTTLPLRRPYSGDPELLNEAEFGEASRTLDYNENAINHASDLGLLEESDNERLLLFQLPSKMPIVKRTASAKGKEKVEPVESKGVLNKDSGLEGLSGGYMGKMLVYKSGAVKLKLGDMLYDVSPGSDCTFAQEAVVVNTAAKHCCAIGELGKRAVVTPDFDYLLDSVIDLG